MSSPVKSKTNTKKFKVIKAVLELILNNIDEDEVCIELFGKEDTDDFTDIFNKHLLAKGNLKHYRLSDVEKTSRVKQYIRRYKDEFRSKSFIEIGYNRTIDGTEMLYRLRGIWTNEHCENNFKEIKELIKSRIEQGYLCFEFGMEDKKHFYSKEHRKENVINPQQLLRLKESKEIEITNILKEVELYEYYKNKDTDKEENEPNIFLIDKVVLLDDVNYILDNKNDYIDEESFDYEDNLKFIEKIEQLQNKLRQKLMS